MLKNVEELEAMDLNELRSYIGTLASDDVIALATDDDINELALTVARVPALVLAAKVKQARQALTELEANVTAIDEQLADARKHAQTTQQALGVASEQAQGNVTDESVTRVQAARTAHNSAEDTVRRLVADRRRLVSQRDATRPTIGKLIKNELRKHYMAEANLRPDGVSPKDIWDMMRA